MKAIDSNLLVYASLANHPAMMACDQHNAAYPDWLTNIVNLSELRRVLVSVDPTLAQVFHSATQALSSLV